MSTPKSNASSESWRDWTDAAKLRLRDRLQAEVNARTPRDSFAWARPKQLPPDHAGHDQPDPRGHRCGCVGVDTDWGIWLVTSGRGWGKTKLGSTWIVDRALANPRSEWAVIAPTFRDVRKTCFEGTTGLVSAIRPSELIDPEHGYNKSELKITLANGSVIYGYSGDKPDRIRGANLWGAWADELSSWRYEETWHEGLIPALRIGTHPRVVVTTTPRPTRLIRDLMSRRDGSVHVTRGSTWENAANLSPMALAELERRYAGTRLGRQELEGELIEDVDGALWARADIDAARVARDMVPDLARVVVAIDPAVTSSEDSDETGIVVAGAARDGHGYVLADASLRGTPDQVMRAAVAAYRSFDADCVVGEVNNGGDYIGQVLRTVDPLVPYRTVRATRGKALRAEPVAALYEQHRVHHVGSLPQLEDQMTQWTPEAGFSPDRLDALVWAITELKLARGSFASAYGDPITCGGCRQLFLRNLHPERCPFCGHAVPE